MMNIDVFGDGRKIPQLSINVKVKIKPNYQQYNTAWNSVFGYIMKKPRTKLEFLAVNNFRNLSLNNITLESIKEYISDEDYNNLIQVEEVFNNGVTSDVKAFILSILKVPYTVIENIVKETN